MKAIISIAKGYDSILILSKKNPDQAAIKVVGQVMIQNDQGFIQMSKRVGLIKGKTEDLRFIIHLYELKEGDDYSEKITPVKLIVKETYEPAYEGHQEKIYPETHPKAGEPVTSQGSYVYRQTIVVSEHSTEHDELLSTDKEEVPAQELAETTSSASAFDKK